MGDDAGPTGLTPPARKLIARANRRRDRIYQLRGQILSDVDALEATVDAILGFYFEPKDYGHFESWLLSAIGLSAKVAILKLACAELRIGERVAGTLARLERAAQIRNEQAHSHVTINPNISQEGDNWGEFLAWHSRRRSRRGITMKQIDEFELLKEARLVSNLEAELFRLWVAFQARPRGLDPVWVLDDHDARNPEQAKAAR